MKILILAGGTGGHIFPALSIAEELTRQGAKVHWLGSHVGLEKKIVESHYPLHLVSIKGVRGKGLLSKLLLPFRLVVTIFQSMAIIWRVKPDLVFGVGGYVAGPGGIAAWILRKPLLIHESNAVAGVTNRLLTKFATQVLAGFPDAFPKDVAVKVVGNPVRPAITAIPEPNFRHQRPHNVFHLLILGGSQGAAAINRLIPRMLSLIDASDAVEIWHQTGQRDFQFAQDTYQGSRFSIRVDEFIENIVAAYDWADLVICRAGAMTVSEIAAAGLPAIFIPFPYAVDDHQFYNAQYLVSAGAALVMRENEIEPETLASTVTFLMKNPDKLLQMAKSARQHARPQALDEIAALCFETSLKRVTVTDAPILTNSLIKNVHFIGIGGIGMSGLAELLIQRGYNISGSDVSGNAMVTRLSEMGARINIGHHAGNVKLADAVVYSSAIGSDNVEIKTATTKDIPIVHRGKLLAELVSNSAGIAVAGTHGKTTTSAILSYGFNHNGVDASFVIGGIINNTQSTSHEGASEYFIAEADESDASFLYMQPKYAVITNIEADHMETYQGNLKLLKKAFIKFLNQLPKEGFAIVCIDDPIVREILPKLGCRVITYGFDASADIRAHSFHQKELKSFAQVERPNLTTLSIEVNLPGKHNLLNALPLVALGLLLKLPDQGVLQALVHFPGVRRRFYSHGEINVLGGKALLFDDYGHHPSEISVTMQAARQAWPKRRIVMVFQPHRYSRTKDLMHEFVNVLSKSDVLLLLEIYSAGEKKIDGIDSTTLKNLITAQGNVQPTLVSNLEDLPRALKNILKADDIVIFQGAGSIGSYANQFAKFFDDAMV